MGSNTKKTKTKEKEPIRKRHRSRSNSVEIVREKEKRRHHHHSSHHKRHHKEKKHRERQRRHSYDSDGSEVLAPSPPTITHSESPPPPPTITIRDDSSPENSSAHEDQGGAGASSLSIDETNRLRAKLGLKPLQLDTPTAADGRKKDDLGEFYHKPAGNIATKNHQEKIRSRLHDKKEKRSIEQKLAHVKTLGVSDSEDDTESWVEKNRRIQKEKDQAAKRAKLLEELDAELGVGQLVEAATQEQRNKAYTQKHLTGLRVEHDILTFEEGTTTVLTLKDKGILEDEDDVLVNVNIVDNEKYQKNNERKKEKLAYNPYENEQVDEYGNLQRKDLLDKYNEEIDGEKKKSFQIGYDNAVDRKQDALLKIKAKLANKRIETLAMPDLKIASDYYTEEEMKFKKPKKKVRKIRQKPKMLKAEELEAQIRSSTSTSTDYLKDLGSRRKRPANADHDDVMDIDDVPNVNFQGDVKIEVEDNELEKALHRARKLKNQEQKPNITAIEPVKLEPVDDEMVGEDLGSIVLNSTAEFCRTLGDIPTYGRAGNRDEEEDLLDFEREMNEYKSEPMESSNGIGGSWSTVDTERLPSSSAVSELVAPEAPILDEEPDVGAGVAAALHLAMSKGYLDKEDSNRPSTSRFAHLQAKNYSIEDKTHGDDDKFGRRDRYSGPTMEFKEKDMFKPNVKLDYIDDEGRVLNAKEAFRYLSHKFHGKGPGKNKIEKRIKKNEQEGLMKKMSSTDTPLGTLNMLQAKQKETQSAYIVLSGSKHTHQTTISKMKR